MKQIGLIFFAFLLFSSCNKAGQTSNNLQGEWQIKSSSTNGVEDPNPYASYTYEFNYKTYYIFEETEDNIGIINFKESKLDHSNNSVLEGFNVFTNYATYEVSEEGDQIKINNSNQIINFNIDKLGLHDLELSSIDASSDIILKFNK